MQRVGETKLVVCILDAFVKTVIVDCVRVVLCIYHYIFLFHFLLPSLQTNCVCIILVVHILVSFVEACVYGSHLCTFVLFLFVHIIIVIVILTC